MDQSTYTVAFLHLKPQFYQEEYSVHKTSLPCGIPSPKAPTLSRRISCSQNKLAFMELFPPKSNIQSTYTVAFLHLKPQFYQGEYNGHKQTCLYGTFPSEIRMCACVRVDAVRTKTRPKKSYGPHN
eukprot:TRINITY_DN3573_c1_g1_i4.p1 TRINITY_DN3573_c1_g1~~TRINITY_DN3573_c1_g1_i4.p1  ORF type:complete len:126 (+),score=6.86 TRINITY_DN3573_c1_g1_i4:434-811(+)